MSIQKVVNFDAPEIVVGVWELLENFSYFILQTVSKNVALDVNGLQITKEKMHKNKTVINIWVSSNMVKYDSGKTMRITKLSIPK